MKTIGIIGGMSPESTVLYYQIINREINRRLGGNSSAKIILDSLNFAEIVQLQKSGQWEAAAERLVASARRLASAGADFLLIATNTMHKNAPAVEAAVAIPLLHVVDATAAAIQAQGLERVGLLGTRFTMGEDFYHERMGRHGISTLIPSQRSDAGAWTPDFMAMEEINRIIFDELCRGEIKPGSAEFFRQVIDELREQGAQGVILGCTEICLLINEENSPLPVFDSTRLHALAAVDGALMD